MILSKIFQHISKPIDKFEHYFSLYEKWLGKFQGKSPKILEIGIQHGGSSLMWLEYFGEGTKIIGVDIDQNCKKHQTKDIEIFIGDQSDENFWDNFLKDNYDFDIIIDDGSHENYDQILTLKKTYNHLLDDGIYWCEDTHTSYYNKRVKNGGYKNPNSFTEYCKNVIDALSEKHTHYAIGIGSTPDNVHVNEEFVNLYNKIQGIHFYDSIIIIEKGKPFDFKRIIHKGN